MRRAQEGILQRSRWGLQAGGEGRLTSIPFTLERSGVGIQSYLSCWGGLRETGLTATVAYILSRFPEHFLPLLGVEHSASGTISIEETEEGDRFDIYVDGFGRPIVIEAKIDLQQRISQIERYARDPIIDHTGSPYPLGHARIAQGRRRRLGRGYRVAQLDSGCRHGERAVLLHHFP